MTGSRAVLLTCVVLLGTAKVEVSGQSKYLEDPFSDYMDDPDMSIIPPTKTLSLYDCTDSHRAKYDDVTQYQVYHNDQWWTQSCPDSLQWNQDKCRCVFADGSEPTVTCRDYRLHSEGVAGKYEQFVNGKWIVRDCSLSVTGLVWDQTACQCVWGPDSSGKVTGQQITPCDVMLNMTFEDGVKDEAKGSFVEVGRGKPLFTEAVATRENPENMAAYFINTALNLWFFSNNELGSSLRLELTFKMEEDPSSRESYQMLLSNGCNVSMPGYTTPSVAIGYRPSDQSYLLAFETATARKAIVCSQKLGAYDWHTISLIYEDGTLLLRVDGRPCIMSQDFSGPVQKTPCPLTIGADPLERDSMYKGYIDDIIIARYCRRFVDKDAVEDTNPAPTHNNGPMLVEPASRGSRGGEQRSSGHAQAGHWYRKKQEQRRHKRVEYVDEEEGDKDNSNDNVDEEENGGYAGDEYDYSNGKSGWSKENDDYGDKDYYDNYDDENDEGGRDEYGEKGGKGKNDFHGYIIDHEGDRSSKKDHGDKRETSGGGEDKAGRGHSGGSHKWWEDKDEGDGDGDKFEYDQEDQGHTFGGKGQDQGRDQKDTDDDFWNWEDDSDTDTMDNRWSDGQEDHQRSKDNTWAKQTGDENGGGKDYESKNVESDKLDDDWYDRKFEELPDKGKSTTEDKTRDKNGYAKERTEDQEYTDYRDDYSKEKENDYDYGDSSESDKWKDYDGKEYTDYDYKYQKSGDSGEDYRDTTPPKKHVAPRDEMSMNNDEGGDYDDYDNNKDDNGDDGHDWKKRPGHRDDSYEDRGRHTGSRKSNQGPKKEDQVDKSHRKESGGARPRETGRMNGDRNRRRMRNDRRDKTVAAPHRSGHEVSEEDEMADSRRTGHRKGSNSNSGRADGNGMDNRGNGGRSHESHRRRSHGDMETRRPKGGNSNTRMGHDTSRDGQNSMRRSGTSLMDLTRKNSRKGDRTPPHPPLEQRPHDGKSYQRMHQHQRREDAAGRDNNNNKRGGGGERWMKGHATTPWEGAKRRNPRPNHHGRPTMGRGNAMNVHRAMID